GCPPACLHLQPRRQVRYLCDRREVAPDGGRHMIHIAPSILAADFSRLGEEVLATERGGAQRIHVDVMDGHFVPNLSMGPVVVKSLQPITRLPFEIHLMVEEPAKFV